LQSSETVFLIRHPLLPRYSLGTNGASAVPPARKPHIGLMSFDSVREVKAINRKVLLRRADHCAYPVMAAAFPGAIDIGSSADTSATSCLHHVCYKLIRSQSVSFTFFMVRLPSFALLADVSLAEASWKAGRPIMAERPGAEEPGVDAPPVFAS